MRKVIFLTVLLSLSVSLPSFSSVQTEDPVLLKINEREVTVSEFEYVYTKNNLNPQVMDPKSIDEYLDLFINFNLKVYEAMQLGLDTHSTFINELDGYREQLAQPYLNDQEVSDQLLEEALERSQHDIRASHILFSLEKHASPQDTLAAWNKAMGVRTRLLDEEPFDALAIEFSDDPSAKGMPATANRPAMLSNAGDLGYFSVLDMVYPFENAAYSLQIDEISMPVRTDFGYHLIKLTDKLPAMGRARVAHIMVSIPQDADDALKEQAEAKVREIKQKLTQGESFESLAERFSDDKASGRRGGELPAFTSNRMVPEFIKAIDGLGGEDTISKPVRTQYGWHIIKLFEKTRPADEEAIGTLKTRISRDSRAFLSQSVVVGRLKKEYDFNENPDHFESFINLVDSTIFEGNWKWENEQSNESGKLLFSFAQQNFTVEDFAHYLSNAQTMRTPESLRSYVSTQYNNFKKETILDYEEQNLAEKYPEFEKIMKEYHDGILLFELTDQKVWAKAMADTVGLKNFFKENIGNYMWDDRYDVEIYTFNTAKTAKSGRKLIRKAHRNNVDNEQLMESLNKDSQLDVSVEAGIFETDIRPVLEGLQQKNGISSVIKYNDKFVVVWVNEFLPSQAKKINEIRGLVIADYQNFLEEKWVKELREKYPYQLNRSALELLNTNK